MLAGVGQAEWLLFYAFTVAPLVGLVVAGVASTVIIYRLGEWWLLLLVVVIAMMSQHQFLEAAEFVRGGGWTLPLVQEAFETTANLVLAGATYYVLSFARDERSLAAELERTTERYNRLLENAPSAIVVVHEGEIVYANPQATEFFDRNGAADLTGRDLVEFVSTDRRDRVQRDLEHVVVAAEPMVLGEESFEVDGRQRWAAVTAAPITYESAAAVQVVIQDTTARHEYEHQLGATLRSMEDAVFVVDIETDEILECNPAACELLGYERDRLLSLSVSDIHPDEMARLERFGEAAAEGARTDALTCRRYDGGRVPVDMTGSTVTFQGRECLLTVVRDISDRKRREQRLTVLDRILRHNLRNDMNVVMGHATALTSELSDPEREMAATIRETASDLVDMSDGLREVRSTLEREWEGDPGHVDVTDVVESVVVDARREFRSARFEVSMPESLRIRGTANLQIAVDEVVENAVVHGGDDVTVRITVEESSREGWVDLRVVDDGPGMPRTERAVFMDDEGMTSVEHGTGFGLWLAIWVVEAFDGEVTITESDRDGTAVVFRLLRADAAT
jgi:PAS domain S-box-containing protein